MPREEVNKPLERGPREEWGRSYAVGPKVRTEEKCSDAREEEGHRRLAKDRQGGG